MQYTKKQDNEILIEENQRLYKWIESLNKRISELEAACVMGGDGKPIGIGQEKFTPYHNGPCIVSTVGEYVVSFTNQYTSAEPKDCYSSPDQVPEVEGGGE